MPLWAASSFKEAAHAASTPRTSTLFLLNPEGRTTWASSLRIPVTQGPLGDHVTHPLLHTPWRFSPSRRPPVDPMAAWHHRAGSNNRRARQPWGERCREQGHAWALSTCEIPPVRIWGDRVPPGGRSRSPGDTARARQGRSVAAETRAAFVPDLQTLAWSGTLRDRGCTALGAGGDGGTARQTLLSRNLRTLRALERMGQSAGGMVSCAAGRGSPWGPHGTGIRAGALSGRAGLAGRAAVQEEAEKGKEEEEDGGGEEEEEGAYEGEEAEFGEDEVLDTEEESWSGDESPASPRVEVGGTVWGQTALEAARKVLARPSMHGLDIFSLRAMASRSRLEIRLDKLEDEYGSPSLDDIVAFSREFNQELSLALGEEAAGALEVEVSSPGAEREVRVPDELERFRDLPMRVVFQGRSIRSAEQNTGAEGGGGAGTVGTVGTNPPAVDTKVLRLVSVDDGSGITEWGLADVRLNRQGPKGSRLTKKQAAVRYRLAPSDIRQVNLYIEL